MRVTIYLGLVLSLLLATSCQTTNPSSGYTGGKTATLWRTGYGLNIRPPDYAGQFNTKDEDITWLYYTPGKLIVLGRAAYVGDIELDVPALTNAILGPVGSSFPAQNMQRKDPVVVDGQTVLLFEEAIQIDKGNAVRFLAGVQSGPWVHSYIALTLPGATEQERNRGRDFWQQLSFERGPTMSLSSISERERGFSSQALMYAWGSYVQRGKFVQALEVARQGMLTARDPAEWAEAVAQVYLISRDYAAGEKELAGLLERFPNSTSLMWRRAHFLSQLGRTDEALALFRASVIDGGEREQDAVMSLFNLLLEKELSDEYIDDMRKIAESLPQNPPVQGLFAHALYRAGKTEELQTILVELERMAAYVPSAAELLSELYLAQEDYDGALRIALRVRDEFKEPTGNYLVGWAYVAAGRYSEAREQLQLAVQAMPGHAEAQRLLELTSSMLGKADTSFLRQVIEPVLIPEGILASIPEPGPDFANEYGVYAPYRGKMFEIAKGSRFRSTEYYSAVILDRKALERVNEFIFPFDPLWERIHVNYLRVYDKTGELIHEGSIDDYYLANNEEQGILATQRKQLHVPVGGAQVGARIEIAVSKESLAPQSTVVPMHEVLSGEMPIQLSFVGVRGDLEDVEVETRGGVAHESVGDDSVNVFSIREPRVYPIAHNLPPAREFLPVVWIGAAGQSWEKQALEYYERISEHFEPSPEAIAKAEEILGGVSDPDRVVAMLTDFVRDSLTYQAIEFGVRAQIPNSCALILRNRYGDCKDHTFLLMQLLRAAGIKAYPALVDNRLQMNAELPDINQFNHVIVYLPEFRGGHFVDATEKYVPLHSVPFGLAGERALIVDPENPRLVQLPDYPRDASRVDIERSMSLSQEGLLAVEETVSLSGFVAAWARANLAHVPEAEAPIVLGQMLAIPAFQHISSVSLGNFADREKPLTISYAYELSRQFISIGDVIAGRLPGTWESIYLRQPPEEARRWAPIWQRQPILVESTITVDLPSNFALASDSRLLSHEMSSEFCTYSIQPQIDQQTLRIQSTFTAPHGMFPATAYTERRNAFEAAGNLAEHPLLLQRMR